MTYSDLITRDISGMIYWHAMGNASTEFTVTFGFPDADDPVYRIRLVWDRDTASLSCLTLDSHGNVIRRDAVVPSVVERMTVANGMPLWQGISRAAVGAFYGGA